MRKDENKKARELLEETKKREKKTWRCGETATRSAESKKNIKIKALEAKAAKLARAKACVQETHWQT